MNIGARRSIGLGGHLPAIGKHGHAQCIGHFDPFKRIGIDRQIPAFDLMRGHTAQKRKIARDHQALDVMRIGMLDGALHGLAQAIHRGFARPVKGRQRTFGLQGIAIGIVGHLRPVNAAHIFPPA